MKSVDVKKLEAPEVKRFLPDKEMRTAVLVSLGLIRHLQEEISGMETMITKKLKAKKGVRQAHHPARHRHNPRPHHHPRGGDIRSFPKVGDYSSYCRCVKSTRISADKVTGHGNGKNGNKYLSWVYIEAAQFVRRFHETVRT